MVVSLINFVQTDLNPLLRQINLENNIQFHKYSIDNILILTIIDRKLEKEKIEILVIINSDPSNIENVKLEANCDIIISRINQPIIIYSINDALDKFPIIKIERIKNISLINTTILK